MVSVTILFAGCNNFSDESMQGDGTVSQSMDVPRGVTEIDMGELGDSTQSCVESYEMQGDEVSSTEKETGLLNCLIEEAHNQADKQDQMNMDGRTARGYALVSIVSRGEGNLSSGLADINLGARNEYDLVIAYDMSSGHSLLLQMGVDVLVYVPNLFNENDPYQDWGFQPSGGLVMRFSVGSGFIGINAFFETTSPLTLHNRLSAGIDYVDNNNKLSVNAYYPTASGWIDIDDYYQERALGGFDLRYERAIGIISLYLQGELFLMGDDFTFFGVGNTEEGAQAAVGLGFGININCGTKISLGVDAKKDNLHFNNINVNDVALGLNLGVQQQFAGRDCASTNPRHRIVEKSRNFPTLQRKRRSQ